MDLDGRLGRLEECLESRIDGADAPISTGNNNQVVPRIVASTMVVHPRSIIHQEPRLTMGLLDSILGKDGDKAKRKDAAAPKLTITNPFAARPQAFGGAGQSLGGTQPGIVIPISLFNPGPLGVKVGSMKRSGPFLAFVAFVFCWFFVTVLKYPRLQSVFLFRSKRDRTRRGQQLLTR